MDNATKCRLQDSFVFSRRVGLGWAVHDPFGAGAADDDEERRTVTRDSQLLVGGEERRGEAAEPANPYVWRPLGQGGTNRAATKAPR